MPNLKPTEVAQSSTTTPSSSSSIVTVERAFSFISKGWREVRDSADVDLQLMRNRANSFKNLASSFDREFENFLNSASKSTFSVAAISLYPPTEIDFMKRLMPKLSEIRRAYSSPDFSKRVLGNWSPRPRIRIDLSAIKDAIVEEVAELDEREAERFRRGRKVRFKEFKWKGEGEKGQLGDWVPIRLLKTRLREFEQQSSSSEIFGGFKNSEFVEKLKSGLKSICKEPDPKNFWHIWFGSLGPFWIKLVLKGSLVTKRLTLLTCVVDHANKSEMFPTVMANISNKIVESLCGKHKNQLLLHSMPIGESSILEGCSYGDVFL